MVIVVMVIHSHCWYMFSWEAVRSIADQHAGLTYCTISHYHTLDTLHLVRYITASEKCREILTL